MIKERAPGMSLIVRTVTRLTVGFSMLYGIFIFSNEHLSPGGGFAGGIIVALAFITIMLAHGKDLALASVPRAFLSFLGSLGVFLLLSVTLLGFTVGYFSLNMIGKGEPLKLFGTGIVSLSYLAIALKVSAGISAIFIALALLRSGRESKS